MNNNIPMGMIPSNMMGTPNYGTPNYGGNMMNQGNIDQRLDKIERQLKRLESRVNRLENPYQTVQPYTNPSDNNNMYMI